ncbi:LysE family transporter [Aeromicrobium sp.]|nr:LysE family transporter [Candidatus Saccharibacteria bacterium]
MGVLAPVAKPHNLKPDTIVKNSRVTSLLTGTTLAVANPVSFIFWFTLNGGFRDENTLYVTLLNISAVMRGALAVFVILIILAKNLSSTVTPKRKRVLSRALGIIITFYGVTLLYKAIG